MDMYMFVLDPLMGWDLAWSSSYWVEDLHSSDVCIRGLSRLNFRAEDPRGWSRCFYIVFLLGFFSKADLREGDHGELNLPGVDDPHLSTDTVIEFQRIFRFVWVVYWCDNIQCLHVGFVYRDIIADSLIAGGDYMVGGYNQTIEIDESMFGMYIWWHLNCCCI